nr:MAG TPA: hypothetical protein [Caudoviricetes sp.]
MWNSKKPISLISVENSSSRRGSRKGAFFNALFSVKVNKTGFSSRKNAMQFLPFFMHLLFTRISSFWTT